MFAFKHVVNEQAAQRMRFDNEFVIEKLMNPKIMRQIVRLISHKDWRIQHNAAILLANCFATSEFHIRAKYLQLCTFGTEYNVINVTLDAIYKLLHNRQFELHEAEYRVCRSLICVVGNFVISKGSPSKSKSGHIGNLDNKDFTDPDKWKKLALNHPTNYVAFMTHILNQDAAQIAQKGSTATEPIKFSLKISYLLTMFIIFDS